MSYVTMHISGHIYTHTNVSIYLSIYLSIHLSNYHISLTYVCNYVTDDEDAKVDTDMS